MITRGLSNDKLLTYAYEIFTDDALHWFSGVRDSINSWNELTDLLKNVFSTPDYDYRLLEEIRSRTQGCRENINIYISIMQGMISRLTKPISEEAKLEVILHNIRPEYASTLASATTITSMEQLQTLCHNFEIINSRVMCTFPVTQHHEPPKLTIAPEFAYILQSQL